MLVNRKLHRIYISNTLTKALESLSMSSSIPLPPHVFVHRGRILNGLYGILSFSLKLSFNIIPITFYILCMDSCYWVYEM